MRETENPEVSGSTSEMLGTLFARSWHVFLLGDAKVQVRGGAGGWTA